MDGLSRNAVKALLSVPDPGSRTGLRDLAFMLLLYGTAARIDEILSLKNRDLHLCGERSHATIIGKGNKVRTLYILPQKPLHIWKGTGKRFMGNRRFLTGMCFIPAIMMVHRR